MPDRHGLLVLSGQFEFEFELELEIEVEFVSHHLNVIIRGGLAIQCRHSRFIPICAKHAPA